MCKYSFLNFFYIKTHIIESDLLMDRKITVCRLVCAPFGPEILQTGAMKVLIRKTHVYFSSVDEQFTSFLLLLELLLLRFCCCCCYCCSSFLNCLCNVACRMCIHVNMHNYFVE